ncbi:PEP-CTERM sorting domain-containing protein [Aestuariibacter sp. GS-14]|uniref:PEP-CTERM sorting domain-containing protein n=1 Tax=Aestuariibacter sp. GS-14 TaxID=2590670 RepID=UPI001129857A|nr:PEP-CTERM sorting domain-containing protein [Aestuariibacter sp. GS-14]TPV57285.1 PEP-CTERM sorting domain-containing protein [Aestuariibacter sp. GS-14]
MKKFTQSKLLNTIAALTLLAVSGAANAAIIVLDFEGIGNQAAINDFYNGGTDSMGNSGTNYGIAFGSNSLGITDADAGGTGNIANEPSGDAVMFFLTGTAILNYNAGFTDGFSFFYSSATTASVFVYDGLNATGNLLATLNLNAQFSDNCSGDPNGGFCNWTAVGAGFAGTAYSIDFGGTVNQIAYDDITFGSATAGGDNTGTVPAPAGLALIGLGLALIGKKRRVAINA